MNATYAARSIVNAKSRILIITLKNDPIRSGFIIFKISFTRPNIISSAATIISPNIVAVTDKNLIIN